MFNLNYHAKNFNSYKHYHIVIALLYPYIKEIGLGQLHKDMIFKSENSTFLPNSNLLNNYDINYEPLKII